MKLQDILAVKGTYVFTVTPSTTLAEVVKQMVEHNIGSMVVCERQLGQQGEEGERLVGIVSERDLLRCFASGHCDLARLRASEIMTTELITATLMDSVDDLMGIMTDHRVRHVPVMSGDRIVGMVSIGDLLKAHHDHLEVENHFMRDYIHG